MEMNGRVSFSKNDAFLFLIRFFQEDILKSLSKHMINPKSSTIRDVELSEILMRYIMIKNLS